MKVRFEKLHEDANLPSQGTAGSAGYDAYAYLRNAVVQVVVPGKAYWNTADGSDKPAEIVERPAEVKYVGNGDWAWFIELAPGEKAIIPFGFKAQMEGGYEAQVRPRSGLSLKTDFQIANAPGTIDADFPGEWAVIVRNAGRTTLKIQHGERVCQLVFNKFEQVEFEAGEVEVTTREGGYGSTGKA
jgi:dUTP pyrophosphatase